MRWWQPSSCQRNRFTAEKFLVPLQLLATMPTWLDQATLQAILQQLQHKGKCLWVGSLDAPAEAFAAEECGLKTLSVAFMIHIVQK